MSEDEKIATLENLVEAQLLGSLLEEKGIPHIIQSFHDAAYDGMFQMQMGWGCVRAPLTHRAEILDILSQLRQSPPLPESSSMD